MGGVWAQELRAATYACPDVPPIRCYIAGLGGRDIMPATVAEVIEHGKNDDDPPSEDYYWIGLKP
jgi:hypothetical protein